MSKSEPKSGPKKAADHSEESVGLDRAEADVAFIEALARILRDNDLAELDVTREYGEDDELQVRLSRYAASIATAPLAAPAVAAPAPAAVAAAPAAAETDAAPAVDEAGMVRSPIVGTAYLQPSPEADAYVQVGDTVAEGETLLLVEAMKVMNAIPSPRAGTVREVLVSNGQPVEFGQPLMIIG